MDYICYNFFYFLDVSAADCIQFKTYAAPPTHWRLGIFLFLMMLIYVILELGVIVKVMKIFITSE